MIGGGRGNEGKVGMRERKKGEGMKYTVIFRIIRETRERGVILRLLRQNSQNLHCVYLTFRGITGRCLYKIIFCYHKDFMEEKQMKKITPKKLAASHSFFESSRIFRSRSRKF